MTRVKSDGCFGAAGDLPAGAAVGTGSVTAPVVVRDEVLFGVTVRSPSSPGGENAEGLYAVDVATGDLRWHAAASTSIRSAPAVLNGTIFVMGGAGREAMPPVEVSTRSPPDHLNSLSHSFEDARRHR